MWFTFLFSAIVFVYPMKNVFVAYAELYAIAMKHVAMVTFVTAGFVN